MTDPLDTEIRKVMGKLSERAPMPPTLGEIVRRGSPRRSRGGFRRWAALATAAAVCAVAVGLVRLNEGGDSARLVTAGPPPTVSGPDVRPETLEVSYVPAGFLLADDTTEPASTGPGVDSAPTSSSAVRRTQRYSDSSLESVPATAAIYVTVTVTPELVQTPAGVAGLVHDGAPIAVNGRSAVIGIQEGGNAGGVEIRWVVSPHVVVAIYSRGGVDVAELRRMAEGIQLRP